MQSVRWVSLPSLSQSNAFFVEVSDIVKKAKRSDLFLERNFPVELPKISETLLRRSSLKDYVYYSEEFGVKRNGNSDEVYLSRDCVQDTSRELQVCEISQLSHSWENRLKVSSKFYDMLRGWEGHFGGQTDGENQGSQLLRYNSVLLEKHLEFLRNNWVCLHKALAAATKCEDRYRLIFFLGTIAYANEVDMELVRSMLALATEGPLRQIIPPVGAKFDLWDYEFQSEILLNILDSYKKNSAVSFPQHPEISSWVLRTDQMKDTEYDERVEDAFENKRDEVFKLAIKKLRVTLYMFFLEPTPTDGTPELNISSFWHDQDLRYYLNSESSASEDCKEMILNWKRNFNFKIYVQEIEEKLSRIIPGELTVRPLQITTDSNTSHQTPTSTITLSDLFARPVEDFELPTPPGLSISVAHGLESDNRFSHTKDFISSLKKGESKESHEDSYASDLLESFQALESGSCGFKSKVLAYKEQCNQHMKQLEDRIRKDLQPRSAHEWILSRSEGWPYLTTNVFIRQLASANFIYLSLSWKTKLVSYGKAISEFQRARRICNLLQSEDIDRVAVLNEVQNSGHTWDAMEHPDWLLLQIENDITIRQHQADIAMAMIHPENNKNSVLQLNMGEGKSSVIVPMVASALADCSKLVRVVVLKPLARQMFQLLVQKLSGMLNRRIFYMPVSRSLKLDSISKAQQILDLYKECMKVGGCLLTQPEHILSFELMGVEGIAEAGVGEELTAQKLIETQEWLDANSRDVLDESDEILSVKFELIYTIGTQRNVEFSPHRWKLIQDVMDVVKDAAVVVEETLGEEAIKVVWDERASFPRINLLQDNAADCLLQNIARKICRGELKGVNLRSLHEDTRYAVIRFLQVYDTEETSLRIIKENIHESDTLWSSMLLLRGLICGGVIAFALKEKRWRVDYGLDLTRTMLAVPFRGKDCPSTRAEFSHPDFTIFATLLSFYYGGLTNDQLSACLQLLFSMDTADEEYALWAADSRATLPKQFWTRKGVNEKAHRQCEEEIFPHFKRSKAVIDFFLAHNVFPREVKEFPEKLSASGWNIAKTKRHPVTGFSGTNDSRYVLPSSIKQSDLSTQLHTNAAVLHCLFREENTFEDLLVDNRKQEFSAQLLLEKVSKIHPPVKVLIDVGAQILELKNEQVASEWLKKTEGPGCSAVVFFSDRDELLVLSRDGTKEPLQISPFANQLDECLVYLDEVHTRGTDLKLPLNYRAAVTLGPKLTKDRLVQACMRMRNLGKGQSVMFCAPEPIRREIIDCAGKPVSATVEVTDVLRWSIKETCAHTRKSIPLWATQGERFYRQRKCWDHLRGKDLGLALREKESKSLKEWYDAPHNKISDGSNQKFSAPEIIEKLSQFGLKDGHDTALQEEQERELSPENEREVQIERPPKTKGLPHSLHDTLINAVKHGTVNEHSEGLVPAFLSLAVVKTGASDQRYYEEKDWRDMKLRVTLDFAKTVEMKGTLDKVDQFLRPVNWILAIRTSRNQGANCELIIVTPFEANKLYSAVKMSKHPVSLHIYSPRTSKSTCSFEALDFCPISSASAREMGPLRFERSVGLQLSLFSGDLYYTNMEKYKSICDFLGLASTDKLPEEIPMGIDGFVQMLWRKNSGAATSQEFKNSPFRSSPVGFLRELVAMRRKGLNFDNSHLGRILSGDLLNPSDFVEARDGEVEGSSNNFEGVEAGKGWMGVYTDVVEII